MSSDFLDMEMMNVLAQKEKKMRNFQSHENRGGKYRQREDMI